VLNEWASVLMGEDNPTFEGLFEFCSISAGGSIGASIVLLSRIFCNLHLSDVQKALHNESLRVRPTLRLTGPAVFTMPKNARPPGSAT
jgi:hypothetical protein